ncbi:MAG: hypothetical protein R6V29_04065 [Spirochaetia bacterium]
MEDDREVKDLVQRSKQLFLREAFEEFRRSQETYNLEEEFAKTKRNRTLVVPAVVVGIVLFFAVAAVGMSLYVDRSTQQVDVGEAEFEDVSLRDVLNSWLEIEQDLEDVEDNIEQLTEERETRVRLAERAGERRIEILELTEMGDDERAERIAEVEQETQQRIAELTERYDEQIDQLEARADDLERRQEEEFDQAQVQAALERDDLVRDERRLLRLELGELEKFYDERLATMQDAYEAELEAFDEDAQQMREVLTQQYEDEIAELEEEHEQEIEELTERYNPDMSDDDIAELLDASLSEAEVSDSYTDVLSATGALSRSEYEELRNELSEINTLIERLQEIPYENSVPEVLEQLESRTAALSNQYEQVWTELSASYESLSDEYAELEHEAETAEDRFEERLQRRTESIGSFEHAFSELIVSDREDGFVVDAREHSRIMVFLDRIRDVDEDTKGVIFREREGFIADVSFHVEDGRIFASAQNVAEDREIKPFDRILLRLPGMDQLDIEIPASDDVSQAQTQATTREDGPNDE